MPSTFTLDFNEMQILREQVQVAERDRVLGEVASGLGKNLTRTWLTSDPLRSAELDGFARPYRQPQTIGTHHSIGLSSSAMVEAAIAGEVPSDRPTDYGDLFRCLWTRLRAPEVLHERMDMMIQVWVAQLESRTPGTVIKAAKLLEGQDGPTGKLSAADLVYLRPYR